MRIDLARPVVSEAGIEAAANVLRSGWLGPGPEVERFEAELAAELGARHVVAVSSGTAALHLAVRLLGLPPGTEVVTTPITFVATNAVLLQEGLHPVFADVDPRTGNLSPAAVEAAISPRTGAVMAVHLGGLPCDLAELDAVAARHGLALVEDCAHACGAAYRGAPIGSRSTFQAFSFHALKNLPMVDGGALCLPTAALADRARRLRWMGIDRDTYARSRNCGYRWDYEVSELGFKYALSDVHAAIGRALLPGLAAANEHRRRLLARYRAALAEVEGVELPALPPDRCTSALLCSVLVDRRDDVAAHLAAAGIGSGVHYKRNDLHAPFTRADVPEAERYWRRTLSLPLHLGLDERDVDAVVAELGRASSATRAPRARRAQPLAAIEA